jgi:signal transduction histidine kinase/ligand-binding sensor domain-containing protein/DNA-binding response OmpR family regulator
MAPFFKEYFYGTAYWYRVRGRSQMGSWWVVLFLTDCSIEGKMFKTLLLAVILVCFQMISWGQGLYFKHLTVNDGLSQHDVSSVLQDSHGFIWIGTYDGLNRFDGFNVLNFSHKSSDPQSLSSNRILCLFEDSQKRIWIGTDGRGINFYSLVTEKFIRVETPKGFEKINQVAETKSGELFFATAGGILKKTNDTEVSVDILQLPVTGLRITDMAVLGGVQVFFSTNQGIWTITNGACKQIEGTENAYCSKMIADKNGNVWTIIDGKLKMIKRLQNGYQIEEVQAMPSVKNGALCTSKDGTVWFGSDNDGLFGFSPSGPTLVQHIQYQAGEARGLLSSTVLSLYCDKDNILWVGNRQGLCYTNLSPKGFQHISFDQLPGISERPHIRALLVQDNYLYFGVQNKGFFRQNLQTKQSEKLLTQGNINPLSIKKIDGVIYVGTNSGVYSNSGDGERFLALNTTPVNDAALPTQVFAICSDDKRNKYFGTFQGLLVQQGSKTDWIHYLFPQAEVLRGKRISSLLYDKAKNCLWIGTISGGLYKLNLNSQGGYLSLEQFDQNMKMDYHIADNTIWCFYIDELGTLWVGTDAGLLRMEKNASKFTQLQVEEIMDKKIMAIVGDDERNLWLNNSQGLIRFNTETNAVRRYSYNDGLQSSTFTEAISKSDDGTLYFGSIHGIDYFHPKQLKPNPYKSSIAISDFKIHNVSISPTKEYFGSSVLSESINYTQSLTLNYKQNNFLFEFTGTNYDNAGENHFRYKLEGYDSGWIYKTGKHRFANYSNLSPGNYVFWADAANSDGVWSENPKKILVSILPAPWFSLWAYLAYFVAGAGIIIGFVYLRNNRQKLRHEIEVKKIQYDRDKEINDLKLMFFTDVAHEFKTPLSLIIGPINDLNNNITTEEHRNFCFKIISRNTKRMMFLVSQLLDFSKLNDNKNILKISKNDVSAFINQITKAFLWQAKNDEINFNVIVPDRFDCYFDRDLVEKVVYNLLSNAFKFTPIHGIVELEVKPIWNNDKQLVAIIVRDSGKGIPDEQKGKIFERYFHGNQRSSSGIGLHLSYSLIQAHKGKLTVSDSAYGGTEFIVSLPVSFHDYQEQEFFSAQEEKFSSEEMLSSEEPTAKSYSEEQECILVVEDDHDLRAYLKNCLKGNYAVFEANNGVEGLKLAVEKIPDIIVTDVMMPEMDGIEMCKRLKDNHDTSHIPILILTAKTAIEQQNQGLEAGAFDYISKPFNTNSLRQKIDNIVDSRRNFRKSFFSLNFEVKQHYTPFDQKLISNAIKVVEDNISDEDFSVEDFARKVGFSRMQLHRKLKSLAGCSATEFINTIKINYATKMFDSGCDRVNEAMDAVGITSYSHFNKLFKKINGKTASEYLKSRGST